jgi:eukaryotic-like serine/threonine-protein kinase
MLGPGARMGRYEVVAPIGAGGMGEVYRARDPKLDRTVALKILPSDIAANPERRLRFEREGRAISKLTHPHICTLHDIGNHDGVEYLVMEYLEGETLAQRLRKGRLPLAQALKIAGEILEALDNAHHQGIVHRDLKPANVMLTRSGSKLLDFGLAKLKEPGVTVQRFLDNRIDRRHAGVSDSSSDAPTAETPITDARMILGTFQYMAPEQIEGREADVRTDIFAFGLMLYEMVTGLRAFETGSQARLIGAILMNEPRPIRNIDPTLPLAIDRLVRRCIAKNPDERWQHARDLLWQLNDLGDGVEPITEVATRRTWRTDALWAGALLAAVGVTALLTSGTGTSVGSLAGPFRGHLDLPEKDGLVLGFYPSFALAPNGSEIVFRSGGDGTTRLVRRRMNAFDVQPIPGTENGHTPFFSPDGQSLGFLADSKVKRVSLSGGQVIDVATVAALSPGTPGAAWGDDGTLVLAAGPSGLMRVREGVPPEKLTKPDANRNEDSHYAPQFLPGGRELLFMVRTRARESRAALLSLRTGTWRWIDGLPNIVGAAMYVATGHLLYSEAQENGTTQLRVAPLDIPGHKVAGGALRLDDVHAQMSGDVALAHFALSASGVVAYVQERPPGRSLVKVARDGTAAPLAAPPRTYRYPRISRDRQIAVVIGDGTANDIYLVDAADGRLTQLTWTGGNTHPTWTPDGRRVTFASTGSGSQGYDLFSVPVGTSARAQPERLLAREGGQFPASWSPTAPLLSLYELTTNRDLLVWSKDRGAERVRATPFNEKFAAFSPNGKWLAYISDQSGRDELWLHAYASSRPDVMVSTDGGTEPVWSPDGRELFFRRGVELRAVAIDPDNGRTGPTTVVFVQPYELSPAETGRPNYDVLPDGSAFVMVRSEPPVTHLRMVFNWLDELRMQLPGLR